MMFVVVVVLVFAVSCCCLVVFCCVVLRCALCMMFCRCFIGFVVALCEFAVLC